MRVIEPLLRLVYPERCAACDAFVLEPGLCGVCAESLYPVPPACPRCAEPLLGPVSTTCFRCRTSPPPFGRVYAAYRYGGELATAIRRWKYGGPHGAGRLDLGRSLAPLLVDTLRKAARETGAELLVPVPLAPGRLRQRGFSQAQVLAGATLRLLTPEERPAGMTSMKHRLTEAAPAGAPTANQVFFGIYSSMQLSRPKIEAISAARIHIPFLIWRQ